MAVSIKDQAIEQAVPPLATKHVGHAEEFARRHEAARRILEDIRALPVLDHRLSSEFREALWDGL